MSGKRWIVDEATLTTEARQHGLLTSYRFHAKGRYTFQDGTWRWCVPNLRSEDFDTSETRWGTGAQEMHDAIEAKEAVR